MLSSPHTSPVLLLALTLVTGCANVPESIAAADPSSPPPARTDPAQEEEEPVANPAPASSTHVPNATDAATEGSGAADDTGESAPEDSSTGTGAGGSVWGGSVTSSSGQGFGVGSLPRTGPRPHAIPGKPKQTGAGLPPEIVQRIVRRNVANFRFCYERELLKDPSFSARFNLRFVIDPSGDVSAAHMDGISGRPELAACVEAKLEGMKFPTPKGGGTVSVSYPFVFRSK